MPLDPRAKRLLDALAATNPTSVRGQSVSERRAGLADLMRFSGPPEAVRSVDDCVLPGPAGDLPLRLYTPLEIPPSDSAGLVYFHGGGLVAGSLDTHDAVARALANASACRVVSVGYRLAPEHRFPAAVEDACAAVTGIADRAPAFGIDRTRLGVAGDSAGATLAAVACQFLRGAPNVHIALQLLLCPILDIGGSSESRRAFGAGYLVDEGTLEHDLLHYLGPQTDPADPRISPLRAPDVAGLPPAIIHAAEFDPLRDEACAYADQLRQAGVAVSYTCHAGMIHLFYGLAGVIPYARSAYRAIGAQVRLAMG
jgi:acetyl esterase/lipase